MVENENETNLKFFFFKWLELYPLTKQIEKVETCPTLPSVPNFKVQAISFEDKCEKRNVVFNRDLALNSFK